MKPAKKKKGPKKTLRVEHEEPVLFAPEEKSASEADFDAWMESEAEAEAEHGAPIRRYGFAGTPKEIGEAHGEALRDDIAEFYAIRLRNALAQAKEYGGRIVTEKTLLDLARRCLPASEAYDPDGYAELLGIARGAQLTLEQVFAMNGLTDLRDVLAFGTMEEGCSSFVVQKDKTEDRHLYLGQSWDLATDNMPYVIAVHRKPKGQPPTWSLTTAGCLSLIGMNQEGTAIGTTNVRSKDSRPGITYLQIIHKGLRGRTVAEVEKAIVDAPRAGAHYYYAGDHEEAAITVECTATHAETTRVAKGYSVHCNHMLEEKNRALEASVPVKSSLCRQARMGELLGGSKKAIGLLDLQRFLADHDQGDQAICRHDYAGISSNGSMIMCPATRKLWALAGPACRGVWTQLEW